MLPTLRLILLLCFLTAFWLVRSILTTKEFLASSSLPTARRGRGDFDSKSHEQPVHTFSAHTLYQQSLSSLSWPNRHVSPLEEFQIQYHSLQELPYPLRMMEQYKAWHSHEALERDFSHRHDNPHLQQRRYIVAYYQCPVSAGNWLHYFTSALYWGMLTNRTVLWKYADEPTCFNIFDHKQPISSRRCRVENATLEHCDSLLTRAPWIASYNAWKDRLDLPPPRRMERRHTQWYENVQIGRNLFYQQVRDITAVVVFAVSVSHNRFATGWSRR